MAPPRSHTQRGQALLLILVFVAAFLLVIWAGLTLASAAFLGLDGVRSDTRNTYALDAGIAYGLEAIDTKHGNGCNAPATTTLTLSYPSGPITVNVAIAKGSPCRGVGATFNLTATASGTARTLTAQVTQGLAGMGIDWESFQ